MVGAPKTAQHVKLGIFLLAGGLLVLAVFVLFGRARLWQTHDRYFVRVPDSVYGLEVGSAVHVHGVRVGRVAVLRLFEDDMQSVTVTLEVDRKTPIEAQAKAYLRLRGVTGLRVIDIDGAGPEDVQRDGEAPGIRPPGSYIPYGRTAFDRLQDSADDLMQQAADLMASTQRLVEQLAVLSEGVDREHVETILERAAGLLTHLESASVELESLIGGTRRPLRRTLTQAGDAFSNVERLTSDVEGVVGNVDRVVTDLRGMVRVNADDLRATMANLREASQNLRQLSRELRRRPSRLLFGGAPEERRPP